MKVFINLTAIRRHKSASGQAQAVLCQIEEHPKLTPKTDTIRVRIGSVFGLIQHLRRADFNDAQVIHITGRRRIIDCYFSPCCRSGTVLSLHPVGITC